jgi:hypothetical protein
MRLTASRVDALPRVSLDGRLETVASRPAIAAHLDSHAHV